MAQEQAWETRRLNRYIARAGICSRRDADKLIESGKVQVNGKIISEYWCQVTRGDQVRVNGKVISPRPFLYILLNKPKDTITTVRDQKKRQTVMDLVTLNEGKEGLFPVGRLDRNTTGALLLTSDGDLGHRLMHPSFQISKQYRVRTRQPVQPHQIDQLCRGIVLEEGLLNCDRAVYVQSGNPFEIGIELHEGKNRQIRRMLDALNHQIISLERVSYAGLTTRNLRRGKWRKLRENETRKLYRMVNHPNRSKTNQK